MSGLILPSRIEAYVDLTRRIDGFEKGSYFGLR